MKKPGILRLAQFALILGFGISSISATFLYYMIFSDLRDLTVAVAIPLLVLTFLAIITFYTIYLQESKPLKSKNINIPVLLGNGVFIAIFIYAISSETLKLPDLIIKINTIVIALFYLFLCEELVLNEKVHDYLGITPSIQDLQKLIKQQSDKKE